MTSPVTTPHRPAQPVPPQRRIAIVIAALVGAAVLLIAVQWFLSEPEKVSSVELANSSELDVRVEVSGTDRDNWLGLAIVPGGATRTIDGVLDQGETWLFRYSSGPFVADPVEVPRTSLEADGWRVEIPASAIQQLTDQGALPLSTSTTG